MAIINIDLEDFDDDDVLDRAIEIIEDMKLYENDSSEGFRERLKKLARKFVIKSTELDQISPIPQETLEDTRKAEHLKNIWNKYTYDQICNMLPE